MLQNFSEAPSCIEVLGPGELVLRQYDFVKQAFDTQHSKMHKFDRVFGPEASQADVFADIKDHVQAVLDGESVCIFAYGQTGAGKTYTMEGDNRDGIIAKSVEHLFSQLEVLKAQNLLNDTPEIKMTCVEIYRNQIIDLFLKQNST